ncbi:MAG: hydrogen gas-evolving membrane-bound hydrogenase subunit E [Planctomycetota bacterium]
MIELHGLLIFMIVAALFAVESKDLLSSVVSVGAVGLGLSIMFLMLKAPDLAMVQIVAEIIAFLILLRTTIRRDVIEKEKGRSLPAVALGVACLALFVVVGWSCLQQTVTFGVPSMRVSQSYLAGAQEQTGAVNVVAAILLDYRVYDTLGEATVLFAAVLGALAILRGVGRKRHG